MLEPRVSRLFCPFFNRNPGAHAPLGPRRERVGVGRCRFEAGRVADGAGHTCAAKRLCRSGRTRAKGGRAAPSLSPPSNFRIPVRLSGADAIPISAAGGREMAEALRGQVFPDAQSAAFRYAYDARFARPGIMLGRSIIMTSMMRSLRRLRASRIAGYFSGARTSRSS